MLYKNVNSGKKGESSLDYNDPSKTIWWKIRAISHLKILKLKIETVKEKFTKVFQIYIKSDKKEEKLPPINGV